MLISSKANPSSQCALYVALQTMKERCLSLQLRLTSVQEENLALRQTHNQPPIVAPGTDNKDLLAVVQELSHSKEQLNDRINMVSSENRQLWSRLSQMTKATSADTTSQLKPAVIPNASNQNLIRSKTFTQNAPNPALRSKMQPDVQGPTDDLSLEEISLKVLNEMLDTKGELDRICSEITSPVSTEMANSYGFGYLNDDETNDAKVVPISEASGVGDDVQLELKRCSDGMLEIRKEVLRQQSDIKVALSNLRKKKCKFLKLFTIYQSYLFFYVFISQSSTSVQAASTKWAISHLPTPQHQQPPTTTSNNISTILCLHMAKA